MMTNVSVFGIGKLGAPMVACLAAKGYNVVAVDTDHARVAALGNDDFPVHEPGLSFMLRANHSRIRATSDVGEAVNASDLSFIVVPTPSDANGEFALDYVLAACEAIGRALREKDAYHVVVLTSTVMPGSTGGAVQSTLEAASGKRCGQDFGLCYSPEFIALGSVIHDLFNPDFILIGESDRRAGDILVGLYHQICDNKPPIVRMNPVNAELAKLAVNTYVTTKISYANMLSQICEHLPGADVDVVTSAVGMDSRIGRKYLKGATGYGGPCFPRDNIAFARLARRLGDRAILAEATDEVNRLQVTRLADLVHAHLPAGGCAGILGLSYKPGTDVVTESTGMYLAEHLTEAGVRTVAYDPAGMDNARVLLGDRIAFASSAGDCVDRADLVVITTPWEEFKLIAPADTERRDRPLVIIDCWRIWQALSSLQNVTYIQLGTGPSPVSD